jgi:hypothetical protein
MERASKVLSKLTSGDGAIDLQAVALAAWPQAVGKTIAARTRPARMVRTRLIVEVEDVIWQRQLFSLTRQICANLARHLGPGIVDDVEFRVAPRRREPQRAEAAQPARAMTDDAEQIDDPGLRRIYKIARKKALA